MGQKEEAPDKNEALNLEWIDVQRLLKETNEENEGSETASQKLFRKLKSEPLVPLGAIGTTGVLLLGLRSMVRGDKVASQKFMRYRIGGQGLTIVALMLGVFYSAFKVKGPQ